MAFIATHLAIPVIIDIAKKKNLVARPNRRSSHYRVVPTLGGIAIFSGLCLSFLLFSNLDKIPGFQYFLFGMVFVFFLGLNDDISVSSPYFKMLGLAIAVSIIVILGDFRIKSFYGFFWIYEINYISSVFITILFFLVIINSMNLIDGIDTLCASLSILSSITFGIYFFFFDDIIISKELVILSAALTGSLIAFLRFNVSPAKIFMGDTGSLIIGLILAFFAVQFININDASSSIYKFSTPPVFALSFLCIPVCDMIKVFAIRIWRKRSPFQADKRHVHHLLVDLGMTHLQTSLIITSASILLIVLSLWLQYIQLGFYTIFVLILGMFLVCIPNILNNIRGINFSSEIENKHIQSCASY